MRVHSIFPVKANDSKKMKCIFSSKFTSADMSTTKLIKSLVPFLLIFIWIPRKLQRQAVIKMWVYIINMGPSTKFKSMPISDFFLRIEDRKQDISLDRNDGWLFLCIWDYILSLYNISSFNWSLNNFFT